MFTRNTLWFVTYLFLYITNCTKDFFNKYQMPGTKTIWLQKHVKIKHTFFFCSFMMVVFWFFEDFLNFRFTDITHAPFFFCWTKLYVESVNCFNLKIKFFNCLKRAFSQYKKLHRFYSLEIRPASHREKPSLNETFVRLVCSLHVPF